MVVLFIYIFSLQASIIIITLKSIFIAFPMYTNTTE